MSNLAGENIITCYVNPLNLLSTQSDSYKKCPEK